MNHIQESIRAARYLLDLVGELESTVAEAKNTLHAAKLLKADADRLKDVLHPQSHAVLVAETNRRLDLAQDLAKRAEIMQAQAKYHPGALVSLCVSSELLDPKSLFPVIADSRSAEVKI